MLQNMERHRNLLLQSNKRQMDIVKQILSDLTDNDGQAFIDPTLYLPSRADFDDLQARYDALVATQPGHKKKKSKKETQKIVELPPAESITPPIDGRTPSGRKKRSLKLEHLVHKMANRRLGVEYLITHFEARGTRDLPPPGSVPPSAEESINQVQEFRPDFRADVAHPSVRPFLDQVWEDVVYDWENGV
ncbi:hypothetical protein TREMEDRAFT_71731, partial [Tremella mesenterica DSM 1558]|uniref:uncharacterized protein n=1 Tax=Tremella mesenterica (strain ATCC 24925 / CBS 8224 / DSM 1558 / NBRC 9311 / NRRL Y-6157 / RJB 2259-6 / UBC 559-6) TaxID=578456 RepID=UPI0003F499DA